VLRLTLQEQALHDEALDASLVMIDGSSFRAHQHAFRVKKGATTRG